MKLVASTLTLERSVKIKIDKYRLDGSHVTFYTGSFRESADYERAAKRLAVDEAHVSEVVDKFRKSDQSKPIELVMSGTVEPKPTYRVRMETGTSNKAAMYNEFEGALHYATPNHVIEWDGMYWTCCLDIDFSEGNEPSVESLLNFAEAIRPTPCHYWASKSGGLHLIYQASGIYGADELAATAGYQIKRRFQNCVIEFLHRSRGVPEDHDLFTCCPDINTDAIKGLLLEAVDVDVTAWLEERGWQVEERHPHTLCPVNPSVRAEANSNPVVVRSTFIECFVCGKDGICCGSRKAGIFPIAVLSGGRINSQISQCVKNFVHYGHAAHVLNGQVKNDQLSRRLYSVLLKLQFGDDPRIPLVFTSGEPIGVVRYNGYWCDHHGKILNLEKGSAILRQLPHSMISKSNGAIEPDLVAAEWLTQTIDLSPRGYLPVTPIHGIMMTEFQELPANKVYTVLHNVTLKSAEMEGRRPKYIPENKRMDVDSAWGLFEQVYPGIDRTLIELLLVGRGCMEHRSGLTPMLFITGPTGSGKTTHCTIAAAIAGDSMTPVYLQKDDDRFGNMLLRAKQQSGFVLFDEFFKYAKRSGKTEVEAMEAMLSLTGQTMIYLIFVGAVPLGDLPMLVWADNEIPPEVKAHEQIGRRMFHYQLLNEVSWEGPQAQHGITKCEELRIQCSLELIEASNAILSHVIERWFHTPVTDFAQVVGAINDDPERTNKPRITLLRESAEVQDKYQTIRELFDTICVSTSIPTGQEKVRFSPPGLKIALRETRNELFSAFELCQNDSEKGTLHCTAISEADLMRALGFKYPAKLDIRKHGAKIAMRFVSHDGKKVNRELLK